ncbi:class I SAM-dependent methyltransferase [Amycolatopsis sp. NPDC023774]|uniref:class I SAM-dependent methyltransferase n=1 Tax=Amycolatopsis sp. NPDC023774 TaxID=3155015 RepID=UPI003404C72D
MGRTLRQCGRRRPAAHPHRGRRRRRRRPALGRGGSYSGLRTRAFDDFLLAASKTFTQIVLLGSGLDTRA